MRNAIEQNWLREVEFLKSLVRVPSDNPPGDCAPIAAVAAEELERLGFVVERHRVPDALVRKNGMISATNLIVRQTSGSGKGLSA
jgi:succinyl-diaminopimelate desuccinylase